MSNHLQNEATRLLKVIQPVNHVEAFSHLGRIALVAHLGQGPAARRTYARFNATAASLGFEVVAQVQNPQGIAFIGVAEDQDDAVEQALVALADAAAWAIGLELMTQNDLSLYAWPVDDEKRARLWQAVIEDEQWPLAA